MRVSRNLCVTALLASCFACAEPTTREFAGETHLLPADNPAQLALDELIGKPMPPLQVADWINGEVTPDKMKGKVVVIDIWATWCVPCRAAVPEHNELVSAFKNDLVFVGVCSNEGQDKLEKVAETDKIAYPVCKDPDSKTGDAYKVSFYPTYVVVDRKGIVRAAGLHTNALKSVVEKLIAEKPAS